MVKFMTWLGILGILFYVVCGGHELIAGRPGTLLWTCHLGALWVGVGLILPSPTCNAIGFLWLVVGVPLWAMDEMVHGGGQVTSILTHVGGLVLGTTGARKLGLPKQAWLRAGTTLVPLYWLCRWVTPERENVNLAFAIWPGWEPYFPSHLVYVLVVFVLCLAAFAGTEFALRKTGFAPTSSRAYG